MKNRKQRWVHTILDPREAMVNDYGLWLLQTDEQVNKMQLVNNVMGEYHGNS